jgi:hypothetical protein
MGKPAGLGPVLERLDRYEGLRLQHSKDSLIILAPREEGFDVRIAARNNKYQISFETWQREVDDLETAWNLVAVSLSNGCRLRLEPTSEGGTFGWLEIVLPDGSWRTLPEEGREPNRLNPAVYYRQNSYVRASYRSQATFRRVPQEMGAHG